MSDRRWDTERQEWVYPADWRTIDSAPKDGTRILAWRKGFVHPIVVEYSQAIDGSGWFDGLIYVANPTHWVHLPESPDD